MQTKNNNGCDVLLISPESRKHHMSLPYALLFLSSFLEKHNVRTSIFDVKERPKTFWSRIRQGKTGPNTYADSVIQRIKTESPIIVGLTCYTSEYNSIMEVAGRIKREANVVVVVGGVHATLVPKDFLFTGSPVDFAVIGDGETPLFSLFESIKSHGSKHKETKGVAYFDVETSEIVNHGCNVESDLSKFPMPDYRKIDMAFYTQPSIDNIRWLLFSGVSIFTGRGCPYNCDFCAVGFLRDLNKEASKMRYRSIDQVIEEIEFLKNEYRIDGFYVLDDCFMISKERTKEFCLKLIEKNLNLLWAAETRANLVLRDEELLLLMKRAGMIQLDFGVESGSPGMLQEINKRLSVDQVKKAFAMCRKHGIRTYANILFNMPNETEKDILLTQQLLKEIKPTVVGCGTTVPLVGTSLYQKYVIPKLTPPEYELYNLSVYDSIVDDRFCLNKHSLDLTRLVTDLNGKYNELRTLSFDPNYWKMVISSYHFNAYSLAYFHMLLKPAVVFFRSVEARIFEGRTGGALKARLKSVLKKT